MEYRTFAKSDIEVSRLGFGGWGIGGKMWQGAEDAESKRVLHKAIESDVSLFDSALVYGNGHSEKLIGEVEKEAGKTLFITSKVPSKKFEWPAKDESELADSFPTDYIIQQTEKSLRNLNRDYLDLQQFHVWNDRWADQDEWKEAIYRLKEQGKVRFFGISINDHQPTNGINTARTGLIDSFQVIFNIFDQSPADELLPFCQENEIAVIVRVPFDEGALTGKITPDTTFPEKDFRNHYFRDDRKQQVWERIQPIKEEIRSECDNLAEGALRFVISFDAVTSVIPGMRKERNLLANVEAVNRGALSDPLLRRLAEHRWDKNFYL